MERRWKGIWIKAYNGYYQFEKMPPAPYFKTVFDVPAEIKKAVIHLCGQGFHELMVNGRKADDRWYAPALTQYDHRAAYIDYDVTHLIKPGGKNILTVQIGSGFYNCHNEWMFTVNWYSWRGTPRLICDVEIDGNIVEYSGMHWKTHPGPVVYDCFHEGEDYDAGMEVKNLHSPDFDDSWQTPFRTIPPGGELFHDTDEPCRLLKRFPGKVVNKPAENIIVYDFGCNIAGVMEFEVSGKAGTKINIQYSEMLTGGRADTSGINMGMKRFESDSYILKGEGREVWHPIFVWHGFRYAELTLSDPDIEIHRIDGLFIGSDFADRGKFESSHPILNQVQQITRNGYRCNFMGIPTDCPTREKFGWEGTAKWQCKQDGGISPRVKV